MALTIPQAQILGREHGRFRAERTYTAQFPYALVSPLSRIEVRRALFWMAGHRPLPSYAHKDVYAREFFEEFYRFWRQRRKKELRNTGRR